MRGKNYFRDKKIRRFQRNKVVLGQNPLYYYIQQCPTVLVAGTGFIEDDFSMEWGGGGGGWFLDDFSALLVLCTLLLLLLYQLYLRSSSIRSQSLGSPDAYNSHE